VPHDQTQLRRRAWLVVAAERGREVRRRLADVVVPEPALNRRQRHAGIHPTRARLSSEIMEMQVEDIRSLARQLPSGLDGAAAPTNLVSEHERIRRQRCTGASQTATPIIVVLNWLEELKLRVPTR
jgi:hypothetical protein